MFRNYLPTREADLIGWVNDFDASLTAYEPGNFRIDAPTIAAYNVTRTRFVDAYAVATNPSTRTRPAIEVNDMAKQKKVLNATRSMVDVIQAWPQMTDDKRRMLNITVRDK